MRPELIPHLLEFDVTTWELALYGLSVALGLWTGFQTYRREGRTAKARSSGLWSAVTWGLGGVAVTRLLLIPYLILPEAERHGGRVDLPLHTYGVAIALGFMLAITLSADGAYHQGIFPGETPPRNEHQRLRAKNAVLDLAFWVLVAAIVGSRLYFIVVNWGGPEGYAAHPENILKFWTGGLVFYGGFLGAVAVSAVYARRHHLNFVRLSDIALPTVSLGQFFGRLGCLAAGCCFGKEVPEKLSGIGLKFPSGSLAFDTLANQRHELGGAATHTPPLYPTQLVDGGGQLLIFLFLTFYLAPRKRFDGQIVLAWLILYPLLRFSDEFLRGDVERGVYTSLHVSAGQLTSLALLLVTVPLYLVLRKRNAEDTALAAAAA
jgi:phosphatidylglycerol:prolipoprotein diacylglycerol transferase